MRFPGGLSKALTLSYDDGVEQDKRLIKIMKAHGLKGTFNLNSGLFAPEGKVYPEGDVHRRMSASEALALYSDSGIEVAVHAYTHRFLEKLAPAQIAYEVIKDRECLESMFGKIVRGMAYPFGTYDSDVVEVLRNCGIAYSRTTKRTGKFSLPEEPLLLDPTCHHRDPELMTLLDKFINLKTRYHVSVFYLWGHSYEFESDNNWEVIEKFAEKAGGRDDVWYATNIEIIDYRKAFDSLVMSADSGIVHNPTSTTVFFDVAGSKNGRDGSYSIAPGETLVLR